jgi:hypothetical protein
MATTMNLIAKQTIGSGGAASVTFSNIPQTFTDLKIVGSARTTQTQVYGTTLIGFNGSSSNVAYLRMFGDGSAVSSDTGGTGVISIDDGANATANTFGSFEAYIPNYRSSTSKPYSTDSVSETNATTIYTQLLAGLWNPGTQAAITSITLTAGASANYVEFSEFSLYGISSSSTQNTTTPLASGGDVITTDGTYWYHTFLYSGTFTPLKNLTCDYLVVAGGGSGGAGTAGGGGAGGLRCTVGATGGGGSLETPLSLLASTAYTATIGAGGTANTTDGSNGSNSIFSTITSVGGGYGTGNNGVLVNGGNGGSGGGARYGGTGGTRTTGQGFAGGDGGSASAYGGGGGGGAGVAGSAGSSTVGGNGGNGIATTISGSSVYYAGGGGGGTLSGSSAGTGGTGGGGAAGAAGTANRGGGGGGANANGANGFNGGSGIIVVRYAV